MPNLIPPEFPESAIPAGFRQESVGDSKVLSQPLQNIQKIFRKLDPYCIDVAEATENKDIASYLNVQMKSKFLKYDEET